MTSAWLLQGADREYWHWTDLNIGTKVRVVTSWDIANYIPLNTSRCQVRVYGREITLTNCDAFTRSHLASEGVELAPVEPRPQDEYQVISSNIDTPCRYIYTIYTIYLYLQEEREGMGPGGQLQLHQTKDTYDSLAQFLHHDRRVLRYYCHSPLPE